MSSAPTPTQRPPAPAGATCTLQLFLDLTTTQASVNGLFAANSANRPSKVWQITGQPNTPDHVLTLKRGFNNPVQVTLTFNLPSGAQFTDTASLPGPAMTGETLMESALRVTAVFARNKKRRDDSTSTFASPFTIGDAVNGQVCTVIDWCVPASALASGSITVPLGMPRLFSGTPNGTDCYIFLVSLTGYTAPVSGAGTFFTDSHDPEIEVNM